MSQVGLSLSFFIIRDGPVGEDMRFADLAGPMENERPSFAI